MTVAEGKRGGTDTALVLAPPPLIFLAAVGGGWGAQHWLPFPSLPAVLGVAGQLVIGIGFVLVLSALLTFRRGGTAPSPYRPTTALVASGPFRFSRNPIYVGFALVQLGIGLCLSNTWMVILLAPALLLIRYGVINREERYLTMKFGDEYRRYCAEVRRWV